MNPMLKLKWLNKDKFIEYYVKTEVPVWEESMYIQGLIDMAFILGSITEDEKWELHDLNKSVLDMFKNSDNDE